MLKHVFLFDATRHIGLVQSLIGSAQAYTSQFQAETAEWYAKPQQASGLRDAGVQVHVVSGPTVWPAIEGRLKELAACGGDEFLFHVLSYDPTVIQAAAALSSPNLAVSALSLATLSRKGGPEKRASAVPVNSVAMPTLAEAIAATKRVLEKGGATGPNSAIKQSVLRRLLAGEDARFLFNPADPSSRTLISDIVDDGLRKDWLQRFRLENKTGTERLFLNTPVAASGVQPISSLPAMGKAVDTSSTMPSIPTLSAKAESDGKGRQRTEQMICCLKKRRIYTPKTIRDYIFKALREATNQSMLIPLSASQLNRQVCTNAENQTKADGIVFNYWYAASDAALEMMFGAGVLLNENQQPIRPGLHARGTKVYGIAPDFEDRCEVFLLEYLIKTVGNITQRDRTALAHALFKVDPKHKSIFDMQDMVDELLVKVQDSVYENEDGLLVIEKRKLAVAG